MDYLAIWNWIVYHPIYITSGVLVISYIIIKLVRKRKQKQFLKAEMEKALDVPPKPPEDKDPFDFLFKEDDYSNLNNLSSKFDSIFSTDLGKLENKNAEFFKQTIEYHNKLDDEITKIRDLLNQFTKQIDTIKKQGMTLKPHFINITNKRNFLKRIIDIQSTIALPEKKRGRPKKYIMGSKNEPR